MAHSDFVAIFPSDAVCLGYLKNQCYSDGTTCPGCQRSSRFHPITGRSAYSCQFCGTHVYPTAGTIFHKSRTSLRLWFWAVFLIGSTRGRITTRQLERELRVTYKTAGRMQAQIRPLIGLEQEQLPEAPRAAEAEPTTAPSPTEPPPSRSVWHTARRRA